MKKKSKPAPLTSNLMPRGGDGMTARSGDANKLGVSALQDEIVARLADEAARNAGLSFSPVQSAPVQAGSVRVEGLEGRDPAPPRPSLPSPEPAAPKAALGPIARQAPAVRRLPVSRKPANLADRKALFAAGEMEGEDAQEAPRTGPSAILGSVFEVNFDRNAQAETPDEGAPAATEVAPAAALGAVDSPTEDDGREAAAAPVEPPPVMIAAEAAEDAAPASLDVDLSKTGTLEDERVVPGAAEPRTNSVPFLLLFVLAVAVSGAVGVWLTRGDVSKTPDVAANTETPALDLSASRPEESQPVTKIAPPADTAAAPAPAAGALAAKPVPKVESRPLETAAVARTAAPPVVPAPKASPPPPAAVAAKEAAPKAEASESAAPTTGYSAQLMSAKHKSVSEGEWTRMSAAYPDLLGTQPHWVVAGNVPNRGTYYRLRVGQFTTVGEVQNFCSELDAKKLACLAVKN